MSDVTRVALLGATGLVGRCIIQAAVGADDVHLVGIARREVPLPAGVRMELLVAQPQSWGRLLRDQRPDALICALGTTIAKSGGDRALFRSIDHDLVLETARAAQESGARHLVLVSAVGASAESRNFYLRVKGEVEEGATRLGFKRVDILQPGLLRGRRDGDVRPAERAAALFSPVADLFLHGPLRRFRSIEAAAVARAALALSRRKAAGRFRHQHDAMMRAAREL